MPHGPSDQSPCDYFDTAGCEDKANFNTASFDYGNYRWIFASTQNGHILVNRIYLPTGAWSWSVSRHAINMDSIDPTATIALGSVFRQSTQVYYNPKTALRYKWIMYFVFQDDSTPNEAGRVCVSYSNNGLSWSAPIWAVYEHTPWAPRGKLCGAEGNGIVEAEAISGFHTTSTDIHLFHLEGNLTLDQQYVGKGITFTWYNTTNVGRPDVLTRHGYVTESGVTVRNRPGGTTQFYFINLDAAYDPGNGRVYLLRVYAAPYDVADLSIPCESAGPTGLATFPIRAQAYDMLVNGDFSRVLDNSGYSWNFVAELGDFYGHRTYDSGPCLPYLLDGCMSSQSYAGGDFDSLTVHKTALGSLYRNANGQVLAFAGMWRRKAREQSVHDVWMVNGNPGGSWRDADLYQFWWPPSGPQAIICQ